jgi:hypothetical protein
MLPKMSGSAYASVFSLLVEIYEKVSTEFRKSWLASLCSARNSGATGAGATPPLFFACAIFAQFRQALRKKLIRMISQFLDFSRINIL